MLFLLSGGCRVASVTAEGTSAAEHVTGTASNADLHPSRPLVIYDDALRSNFVDGSWCARDLNETTVVHTGKTAISMQANAWTGLAFNTASLVPVAPYGALDFWTYGTSPGGQKLTAILGLGGTTTTPSKAVNVENFITGGKIVSGAWSHVSIPFSYFGVTAGQIASVTIQANTGDVQPTVYLDDITLTLSTGNSNGINGAANGGQAGGSLVVYDSGVLENGFVDRSWATHDLVEADVVMSGQAAMSMEPTQWEAVRFETTPPIPLQDHNAISLWLNGGSTGNQELLFGVVDQNNVSTNVMLAASTHPRHPLAPTRGSTLSYH